MKLITDICEARGLLKAGGVIAYPTEAVYGLGCSPFNRHAVEKIWALKQREKSKGFILLIAEWSQLTPLIAPVSDTLLEKVQATWPGPVTWIFPKSGLIPDWLSGQYEGIAIRMSAHPIAHQLCMDGPVVSTSANISGCSPVLNELELRKQFPQGIDAVVDGELGGLSQPSAIYDVLKGTKIR